MNTIKDIVLLKLQKNLYIYAILLFSAILIRLIFIFLVSGYDYHTDTDFYYRNANILLKNNFSFSALIDNRISISYWLFSYLLALMQIVSPSNVYFVLVIQLIYESITVIFVYKIALMVFSKFTAVTASIIYIFSWNIFIWDSSILTEALFLLIINASIYYICILLASNEIDKRLIAVNIILLILVVFTRPTFFPYTASVLIALVFYKVRKRRMLFVYIPLAAVILFVLFIGVRIGTGNSVGVLNILNLYSEKTHIGSLLRQGVVVEHRPQFNISPIDFSGATHLQRVEFIAKVIGKRAIAYWYIFTDGFSNIHKIANWCYYVLLYLFTAVGLVVYIVKFKVNKLIFFLITVVVFFNIFHAFTIVDHAWRYRLPCLPILVIFEASGFEIIVRNFFKKSIRENKKLKNV